MTQYAHSVSVVIEAEALRELVARHLFEKFNITLTSMELTSGGAVAIGVMSTKDASTL